MLKIIEVTPENALEETLFCVKDIKSSSFEHKSRWFKKRYSEGLCIKILKDSTNRMIGFIEYVPALYAWRPVEAPNFMFIHCMYVYSKKDRNKGYASMLIDEATKDAQKAGMAGICVMTSKGAWISNKGIFEKNNFHQVDKRGRFELLSKKWMPSASVPKLKDWTAHQSQYQGWHLLYSDQCPWHDKSVMAMAEIAKENSIDLKIKKIRSAQEAQNMPSGYGVFNLLHNGKLLEDHYISPTRFKTMLKKELQEK